MAPRKRGDTHVDLKKLFAAVGFEKCPAVCAIENSKTARKVPDTARGELDPSYARWFEKRSYVNDEPDPEPKRPAKRPHVQAFNDKIHERLAWGEKEKGYQAIIHVLEEKLRNLHFEKDLQAQEAEGEKKSLIRKNEALHVQLQQMNKASKLNEEAKSRKDRQVTEFEEERERVNWVRLEAQLQAQLKEMRRYYRDHQHANFDRETVQATLEQARLRAQLESTLDREGHIREIAITRQQKLQDRDQNFQYFREQVHEWTLGSLNASQIEWTLEWLPRILRQLGRYQIVHEDEDLSVQVIELHPEAPLLEALIKQIWNGCRYLKDDTQVPDTARGELDPSYARWFEKRSYVNDEPDPEPKRPAKRPHVQAFNDKIHERLAWGEKEKGYQAIIHVLEEKLRNLHFEKDLQAQEAEGEKKSLIRKNEALHVQLQQMNKASKLNEEAKSRKDRQATEFEEERERVNWVRLEAQLQAQLKEMRRYYRDHQHANFDRETVQATLEQARLRAQLESTLDREGHIREIAITRQQKLQDRDQNFQYFREQVHEWTLGSLNASQIEWTLEWLPRILRQLGRYQIVHEDEDLSVQVIELHPEAPLLEALIKQIWNGCRYLKDDTQVPDTARGELDPSYARWFEKRSYVNDEPDPEPKRPAKRPHVQAFNDKIHERLAWGEKEKGYQAIIHVLEEKLRNLHFEKDLQAQEAEGEKKSLIRKNEALHVQLQQMNKASKLNEEAKSRKDRQVTEFEEERERVNWVRLEAQLQAQLKEMRRYYRDHQHANFDRETVQATLEQARLRAQLESTLDREGHIREIAITRQQKLQDRDQNFQYFREQVHEWTLGSLNASQIEWTLEWLPRILRQLGRYQIVHEDEDLSVQVIELHPEAPLLEALIKQIWNGCRYLKDDTQVPDTARGELDPSYARWFEKRSYVNDEPDPEPKRPAKRPHVQAFNDKIHERLAWGEKEKGYQAIIHVLEEKLRNLHFEKDLQAQEAEGEKKSLIRKNEALHVQLQQMNKASKLNEEAKSRKDRQVTEFEEERERVNWVRLEAQLQAQLKEMRRYYRDHQHANFDRETVQATLEQARLRAQLESTLDREGHIREIAITRQQKLQDRDQNFQYFREQVHEWTLGSLNASQIEWTLEWLPRILRQLGRYQIVHEDEDLSVQVIELHPEAPLLEALIKQIWNGCRYLKDDTQVPDTARGELDPSYARWFEKRSYVNDEPDPEPKRPAKRPHVQAFNDKIHERLAWGEKEKGYQAIIHVLEEKLRNLHFEKDLQAQEAEGEKKSLIRKNEALHVQLQQMNKASKLNEEAKSRKDRQVTEFEEERAQFKRDRVHWVRLEAQLQAQLREMRRYNRDHQHANFDRERAQVTLEKDRLRAQLELALDREGHIREIATTRQQQLQDRDQNFQYFKGCELPCDGL
ncbi:uncharacterized protein [Nicotiana tomentosiformis]|uniref:uncharacterized protein n=1 Tax=Nicotiana tomentosiformis TaxID=4098 RepID=UPI00388CD1DB